MGKKTIIFILSLLLCHMAFAQKVDIEVVDLDSIPSGTNHDFMLSDSVVDKMKQKKLTRLVYDEIVREVDEEEEKTKREKAQALRLEKYENLKRYAGKRVRNIEIQRLDAFGPTFEDTAHIADQRVVRWVNSLNPHTSNATIKRNLFIENGQKLKPENIIDNERILRELPFIKDARIDIIPNPLDTNVVDLRVLTKDRFAYDISFKYRNPKSGSFLVSNDNTWGRGHEIGVGPVWNFDDEPKVGLQAEYGVNNYRGLFSDLQVQYYDTYRQKGVIFLGEKPFLRMETRLGGGGSFYRMFHTDNYYDMHSIIDSIDLNYRAYDLWAGYSFNFNADDVTKKMQLVLTGRYQNLEFYERPTPGPDGNNYFKDSRFWLGGISLSHRTFTQDKHVYGYGITEDIPNGYLHEIVFGYDQNEESNRFYTHLYLSTGNLLRERPGYVYFSLAAGGYYNKSGTEQGIIEASSSYISKLLRVRRMVIRQFLKTSYVYGANRYDQEYLVLNNQYGIRGFSSNEVRGQQKLVFNSETVFFLPKRYWGFNVAAFAFTDIGLINQSSTNLFRGDWYAGLGLGLRIKNESLIFNTVEIRLAVYPGHPSDQKLFGFEFSDFSADDIYNFEPRKPEVLEYR